MISTHAAPELKARDISNVAGAIRALIRVSGINGNHDRTINAALAAAQHYGSNEFSTYQSELGALMDDVVAPYRREITDEQARRYYRAKSQKWSRAYKSLADEQARTGYWFVTMKSGGINDDNEKQGSKIVVDTETILKTVQRATRRGDYKENPRRAFEQAAKIALADKPKVFTAPQDELAAHRPDNENLDPAKRDAKCFIAFAYRLYEQADKQNMIGSLDDLVALRESLKREIDQLFDVRITAEREAKHAAPVVAENRLERINDKIATLESSRKSARNENCNLREIKGLQDSGVLKSVAASDTAPVVESEYFKGVEGSQVSTGEASSLGASPVARALLENEAALHDHVSLFQSQGENDNTPPVTPKDSLPDALENDWGVYEDNPLACAMEGLDVASSVGVERFMVLLKDDRTNHVEVLAKAAPLRNVVEQYPAWFARSEAEQKSLILDMKSAGRRLIQVDEANAEVCRMLAPVAFKIVETSPENGQAFLMLPDGLSDKEAKAVKERLFDKLKRYGANKGASGGLRWIGTHNFKPHRKSADGSFPRVRLLAKNFGRITTPSELETLGLLAPPRPAPQLNLQRSSPKAKAKRAPSYERAAACVKRKPNGLPDRSGIDLLYAVTCLNWGFSEGETIDLINSHSAKARSRKDDYAAQAVADATQRLTH
jgi:hypothetical protein